MFVTSAHILHADLDSFFASVEQRDKPWLRGKPVLVGGGVVLAASYEAKAFGIKSAMGGRMARELCPHAIVVQPRFEAYSQASKDVFEIFRDTTLLLPPFSRGDAIAALGRLRIAPLLAGVRGEPPMDVDVLGDAVVRIGELMLDPAARVMSLDLNPVLLDSAGKGCVVVDAVVFQG